MFTHIFEGMMNNGLLRRDDPEMLAFAYTAPISALIHLCARKPEKTDEAMEKIEQFSRHFIKTYGI
ncbi:MULTISPECIES: hypothetical protein [unclassified Ruminococcus]|uniref:hypothetical protein n=1 Tax=unclassified Ruminococcus TaxID=2608920 RepID=UPI001113B322|nr:MULTISPECIES: hypothetical protein [unclassified Ruminococcus]